MVAMPSFAAKLLSKQSGSNASTTRGREEVLRNVEVGAPLGPLELVCLLPSSSLLVSLSGYLYIVGHQAPLSRDGSSTIIPGHPSREPSSSTLHLPLAILLRR